MKKGLRSACLVSVVVVMVGGQAASAAFEPSTSLAQAAAAASSIEDASQDESLVTVKGWSAAPASAAGQPQPPGGPTVPPVGTGGAALAMERLPTGNPKLTSSLNQLLDAERGGGSVPVDAFASAHGMLLDAGRVQVVIETTPAAIGELRQAVAALGGAYQTHYRGLLQALLPIEALTALVERGDVTLVREPLRPIPASPLSAAAAESEGLGPSNASAWHAAGYTGLGVRVAVIGGGFGGYGSLLGSDLPASVTTYDWTGEGMGGSEHGTACAEIVHDMAPDAAIDLHKISSDVELGSAVDRAIADGVDVISLSEGFPVGGPGDGTGYLAEIVAHARDHGIFFAVAAGNQAQLTWSGPYQDAPSEPTIHQWPGGNLYNCLGPGPSGSPCAPIPAGTPILVALRWDDWDTVDQDYNLGLFADRGAGWEYVTASANPQGPGCGCTTPTELIYVLAPYDAVYSVVISKFDARGDACLYLTVAHFEGQVEHLEDAVAARSLFSPADSADAIAVGALDVDAPYTLEPYSSRGPTFGPGGACSGGFTKPDIAGYANVSTESWDGAFPGTSAATPHVAGAAALVKQAYPAYSVSQVQGYLESHAVDLGAAGKDTLYGAGRLYLGTPNRPPYAPSAPSPVDGATEVSVDTTLGWTGGDPDAGDTVMYDVYMEAGDPTPDNLVCLGVSTGFCDPGTLVEGAHYYWAVEARDDEGASTRGEAWDFTTVGDNTPPDPPANPTPADGAVDQSINVDLSWTGADPDPGDTVTYDVYLEAGDPTPDDRVCEEVETPFCDPGILLEERHYYWAVEVRDNRGFSTMGDVWEFSTVGPNTPPTINELPDQELAKNSSRDDAIDLWAFVEDVEDSDADLTLSIVNTPAAGAGVTIDGDRTIDINPEAGWTGVTEVEVQVEDTGGLTARETFEVRVRSASFIKHVVRSGFRGAHSVYATDVDGDGDVDILGAAAGDDSVVWWENDGHEDFAEHVIESDFNAASAVYAVDMDDDGDVDVLGTADWGDDIAWWENDGDEGFSKHEIDGAFQGAYDVHAVDLDGDGDMDVLGAASSDDDVAWWENDGDEGFTKRIIDGDFDSAQSVYAADVDGDGDVDVLGAAYHDDTIAWWENDGGEGFTKRVIDGAFGGAASVYATDVDGDGDVDVLGSAEDASDITWWENNGAGVFIEHSVDEAFDVATCVFATDVDGDGAVDVLGTSWYEGVAWWENDGGEGFTEYAVDDGFLTAQSVYATDVDGDGDVDVLAASEFGYEIAWWEQIGASVRITDLTVAQPALVGQAVAFTATVSGADPITYTWDFNSDGSSERVGVGLDVVTHTFTATGTYTVTLEVENAWGEDRESGAFEVGPGEVVRVGVVPSEVTLQAGQQQLFTATCYDGFDNEVGCTATWNVADADAGSIDVSGLFTAGTAAGSYPGAVVATVGSRTGTADVTIETFRIFLPSVLTR